ncbi:MAG: hypothetical protein LBK54_05860 [Propionibacteriaceae bacterium]|nr:hypothetical protein [Propionibacteriaceae bacterium]
MAVLQALKDEYAKGAAWDTQSNTVTVTVFADGDTLSAERLRDYESRAAAVVNGAAVVVRVDPGAPPTLADS